MNLFTAFTTTAWVTHLGWTLIHFLWQGAAIAGMYFIARLFVTAPRTRYALSCAALILMLAALVVTFAQSTPMAANTAAPSHVPATPRGEWSTTPSAPVASTWSSLPLNAIPWFVMAWLTGATALVLRLLLESLYTGRLGSGRVYPASLEWQTRLSQLGVRIGLFRKVGLVTSNRVPVLSVIGWLRPVILLPAGALSGIPADQLEALLIHELAHVRRHDYLVNLIQRVSEAMLFYHPAVWWISGEIRRERENCCDDIAVLATGDAVLYAEALAGLAASGAAWPQTALAANGGSLRHRILRILTNGSRERHIGAPLPLGILAAVALLTGTALLAQSIAPKPAFEATAITLSPPEYVGFQTWAKGDRYTALTASVRDLVAWAYGIRDFQISGGPGWASTTHYNISAKMESPGVPDARPMVQTLLADRFGLRFHRDTRDHSGYALVVDKDGPKLKESPNPGPGLGVGRAQLTGRGANMRLLSNELSSQLQVPIADRTGLTALYDFRLKWSPDLQTEDAEHPSVFTAVREQLGLRLEPVKNVSVEFFLIDSVHQPSGN